VGGVLALADAASSAEMMDSTSSIQMRTFSGLRSGKTRLRHEKIEDVTIRTCMNDPATPMHVIQPQQDLLRDLLHEMHRHSLVLVSFDETEEILAENLKDHAHVDAIWAFVLEVIEKRDDMRTAWMSMSRR